MSGNSGINCASCHWFTANAQAVNQGECHRYPPQIVVVPVKTLAGSGMAPGAMFPAVASDASCGEFRPKSPANS